MLFRPSYPPIPSSSEVHRGNKPGNRGEIFYPSQWEYVRSRVLNVLKYIIMGDRSRSCGGGWCGALSFISP